MSETLWTYIVRCKACGAECNRAEHVPEGKRTQVALSAPFMARCPDPDHNTFSDMNLAYIGEWVPEEGI